ncbi:MAG: serine acetyltransferase [Bacteroidia bacterium]|nr:serine acetyltransferase [Bacteroidia bacterium]
MCLDKHCRVYKYITDLEPSFLQTIFKVHQECPKFPTQKEVRHFIDHLIGTLFPALSTHTFESYDALEFYLLNLKEELYEMLYLKPNREGLNTENNTKIFFEAIPEIYEKLNLDVDAIYLGDPAAKSRDEVVRSYPGFYAIACYRFAHELFKLGVKIIPRMISEYAHSRTGIEIHPGASIGKSFCIDHGTGIVIGETTVIGDNVKIYQGVTLGALSVSKEDAELKRHPTIEDGVVIYAGATILGGHTIVGKNSVIGGNVWVTRSVPEASKIYYQAQQNGH